MCLPFSLVYLVHSLGPFDDGLPRFSIVLQVSGIGMVVGFRTGLYTYQKVVARLNRQAQAEDILQALQMQLSGQNCASLIQRQLRTLHEMR